MELIYFNSGQLQNNSINDVMLITINRVIMRKITEHLRTRPLYYIPFIYGGNISFYISNNVTYICSFLLFIIAKNFFFH